MIFNFRIILYLARKIAIIKKSPSFMTINVEYAKIIILKILNLFAITKLNGAPNFFFSECKVVMIIFEMIIRNGRYAISSCAIHYMVQNRCLIDCKKICWGGSSLCVIVLVSPVCGLTYLIT